MALLKIARMGHPVLLRRADPVSDPTSPDMRRLVADMIETMEDAGGVGLAAPQVHVPLRLFVYRVPGSPDLDGTAVLFNPDVTPLGEDKETGWEGCLSIPGLRGAVPRFTRIRYTGTDAEGGHVAREAEGLHARIVQHETDHLDGLLYTMRLEDFRQFAFEDQIRRNGGDGPRHGPASPVSDPR